MFDRKLCIELLERLYPNMSQEEFEGSVEAIDLEVSEGSSYEDIIRGLVINHPYDKNKTLEEIFRGFSGGRLIESDRILLQELTDLDVI